MGENTAIAGTVLVKEKSAVMFNGLRLHNVAYVSDNPFNLSSISAALKFTSQRFVFDKNKLCICEQDGSYSV